MIALNVKTSYTVLKSLNDPAKLANKAKKLGYTALAITDINNLYSTFEIMKSFKKEEIKPIIGVELIHEEISLLLYAKNYEGYLGLCKIVTSKNKGKFNFEMINQLENVILVIPFQSKEKFTDLNIEISDYYYGYETKEERNTLPLDLNKIFIKKVLYLNKGDNYYLDFLYAIKDGKIKTDEERERAISNLDYLLSKEELLGKDLDPKTTIKFEKKCNFIVPKSDSLIPIFQLKEGINSGIYFTSLVHAGLKKRLNGEKKEVYYQRIAFELKIIKEMGFIDYFLIVWDFIREAKKRKILVGPGRGSAAGSLVAYALGITEVDPIEYGLLFERFLNPERITMPDIDIDFPDDRREEVIDYVRNKYGNDFVAGIITFGTFGSKAAFRDVSRTLSIPLQLVDRVAKQIPNTKTSLKELYLTNNKFKEIINQNSNLKEALKVASYIEGLPRHTSLHAAGIILSQKPLAEVIPLAFDGERHITGYTMNYLEDLGLLKMDFLGIRNLTLINNIINKIDGDINFYKIPLNDDKTLELFRNGDTVGIFQFESNGMIHLLKRMKPTCFLDVALCNALFRPGPMASIDSFLNRREGKEKIDYIHPDLKDILTPTAGIIIYQEQIMQIVQKMASYSLGEADVLRRAMSKKKKEVLTNERKKFVERSIKNNYSQEISNQVYDLIFKFANYGFNKAHAVAYSMIGVKMAYLKANYPKYYYSELLTNVIGGTAKTKQYLEAIKKLQIKLLRPNINQSQIAYTSSENGIQLPFSIIKGIGKVATETIVEKRKEKKFADFFDFVKRTYGKAVTKAVISSLIDSGAFQDFEETNRTLHTNLDKALNYAELASDLDEKLVVKPVLEKEEEFSKDLLLEKEINTFGFYIDHHPTVNFKNESGTDFTTFNIKESLNKNVSLLLYLDTVKRIKTKNNENMAFLGASDEYGAVDLTVFPKTLSEYEFLSKGQIVLVTGRVEKRLAKISFIVNKVKLIS